MWKTAHAEDHPLIIEMSMELYQEDPGSEPVPIDHIQRTLGELTANPTRGRVLVLKVDGKAEGYALLITFWSNELGGEIFTVDELYVRQKSRGQGHASALLKGLIEGQLPGVKRPMAVDLEVTPKNARAMALYSRLGFSPLKNAHLRFRLKHS